MQQYETERLSLRGLTIEDSGLLLDYFIRNKRFLREWEPFRDESFYTEESVKSLIESGNQAYEKRNGLSLYLFNKGENRIIGNVALSNIVYGVFQSCFLGYKMDESEINKGKVTEALGKLIEIAFAKYNLHRIEANIIPRNIRSIQVVKKLGFLEEGLSKKYLKINGRWEDHLHFVLLNEAVE
jgi:[ribosomal protein S5]-alanine N-acetyltransferase